MKNKIIQHVSYWLGVITIGLFLGLTFQVVRAWVSPTNTPPNGNLGAPINTSGIEQSKAGRLNVNTTGASTYGLVVPGAVTGGVYGAGTSYGIYGRDTNNDAYGYLGNGGYGVYAYGTSYGVRGLGGSYGVRGEGTSYGVYGYDTNNDSQGYLGYSRYGVYSIGSGNYGLYSRDGDGSSYTHLNYANYGVYSNSPVRGNRLCIGSDCRSSWPSGGDNLGNHTATTTLNMNNKDISNIKELYVNNWIRKNDNDGIYWGNNGWHIYPQNKSYMRLRSGNSSVSGIRFNTNGTDRNYLYQNSSNNIGFLTTGGAWGLRMDNSKNVWAYGSLRTPILYDNNNTGYYWNGNGESRMYRSEAQRGWGTWVQYDANNTSYYLDPSSNSAFNRIYAREYHCSSDIRLKEKIVPLNSALNKVSQLEGVSFNWRDKNIGTDREIGLIAQEVEKVFPEVVSTDEEGYKSVQYANLVAPIINAIKELDKKIEDLFNKYYDQQKEIDSLKQRMELLENKLN